MTARTQPIPSLVPRKLPRAWLRYALYINRTTLPLANKIDESGNAFIRPIAERMFFDLCGDKRITVDYKGHRCTLKKRGTKYALERNGKITQPYAYHDVPTVIDWLADADPVLRLIPGEKK